VPHLLRHGTSVWRFHPKDRHPHPTVEFEPVTQESWDHYAAALNTRPHARLSGMWTSVDPLIATLNEACNFLAFLWVFGNSVERFVFIGLCCECFDTCECYKTVPGVLNSRSFKKQLVPEWLIDYLRFYVPLNNLSLIWRRHHCRWRAAKFRLMIGVQVLWAGRDLYRATPTVTRGLGISGLIRRTTPFSRLLQHT
jgi:hypothetical protein